MAPTKARLMLDRARPPAEALARAGALLEGVTAELPALLYLAPLSGEATCLGAYQVASQALAPEATGRAVRRRSGGRTVFAGDGIAYLALCLHDASSLMKCPPGRILNRNVRGTLASLRALGLAAHYFGRDFVSIDTRPGAYLAWDQREDARVLVELFLAVERSHVPAPEQLGYPPAAEDPMRGKAPITLREAGCQAGPEELAEAFARGHAQAYGLELETGPPPELAATATTDAVAPAQHTELVWSAPREEAIGFVSAGVALDDAGKLTRVALGGDLLLARRAGRALSRALAGQPPDATAVGRQLDALLSRDTGALEGVRSLKTLRDAILEAADRARSGPQG